MATSNNITTRRAVVAGLALSPVAALPATAQICAVSGAADPVLPAFARWRAAVARYEAALAAFDAADDKWREVHADYPGHIELGGWSGHKADHEDINKHFDTVAHIYGIPDADRHFIDGLAQSARDRLDALQARRKEAQDAMGYTAADEETVAAGRAVGFIEDELVKLTPTTLAGALALVKFLRVIAVDEIRDPQEIKAVFGKVEAFLEAQGARIA